MLNEKVVEIRFLDAPREARTYLYRSTEDLQEGQVVRIMGATGGNPKVIIVNPDKKVEMNGLKPLVIVR